MLKYLREYSALRSVFLRKIGVVNVNFFFFYARVGQVRAGKSWTEVEQIVAKFLFFGCFSFYIFSYIWVFPNFIQLTPVCNHKKGKKCCKQAIFLNRQICTFFSYLCFYVIKPDNLL